MSLWHTMRREAVGVVRSVCYDLGLIRTRRGKPTRRLVIAAGALAAVATGGFGAVYAIVNTAETPQRPSAETPHDVGGGEAPGTANDPPFSGVGKADSAATRSVPPPEERPQAASPTPERTRGASPTPDATSPRPKPPAPTPTSPSPSKSPSGSPSPSASETTSSGSATSPSPSEN